MNGCRITGAFRLLTLVALATLLLTGPVCAETSSAGAPPEDSAPALELRGLWVDAFHDGIKTPDQVDKLIRDALATNVNTLFVQVRRRGDAYYDDSPWEPRTEDPRLAIGFDPLRYLIDRAHARNLAVHAWLTTLPAWNSATPPSSASHVWNLHGPGADGQEDWVSYRRVQDDKSGLWSDKVYPSYDLDPGNPAVIDHTVMVALDIVSRYDVDGLQLDLCRYAGLGSGYNPTSVARYNARYGTVGLPSPGDAQWSDWRREQVTSLVRRVYLETLAVKPGITVSTATIAWGAGPITESDFNKTRTYAEVFQDWRSWLAEGIIDLAVPMNYDREWNETQRQWFDQWIEWEKDHQYGRLVAIGIGAYQQYPDETLAQIRRAGLPSQRGNRAAGVVLYSYAATNVYANDGYAAPNSPAALGLPRQPHIFSPATNDVCLTLLSQSTGYTDPVSGGEIVTEPVFRSPVPPLGLPWKSNPRTGHLMGTVPGGADHVKVSITGPESGEVFTDGLGWFGVVDLKPGLYHLAATPDGGPPLETDLLVEPGRVSKLALSPGPSQNP